MNPIRLNEREAREFSSELRNDRSDNVRRRRPGTIATACGLGAASSSCSYAAVVIARALFRKGANFTAAMAIELGSMNLVADVGIIMAILLGWQFRLAQFMDAPLMLAIMAVLFRIFLKREIYRDGARAGQQRHCGCDGGSRRNAHGRYRRTRVSANALSPGTHRDQPLLRHGLGFDLEGHRRRPADKYAAGVAAGMAASMPNYELSHVGGRANATGAGPRRPQLHLICCTKVLKSSARADQFFQELARPAEAFQRSCPHKCPHAFARVHAIERFAGAVRHSPEPGRWQWARCAI